MPKIQRCEAGYAVELTVELAPPTPALSHSDLEGLAAAAHEVAAVLTLIPGLEVDALELERPLPVDVEAGAPWRLKLLLAVPGAAMTAAADAVKDFQQLWDEIHAAAVNDRRRNAIAHRRRLRQYG